MAGISWGKEVIVGADKIAIVADHDFSKISINPDAVLIHGVPEPDNCEHQISLNHIDNKSEDEDTVITVNMTQPLSTPPPSLPLTITSPPPGN